MWVQGFTQLAEMERSAARALLRLKVLPADTRPSQRVNAVLTSQLLGLAQTERRLLNIITPHDGASHALISTVGLLITDFLHQQLGGARLQGHVLLVTHAVTAGLELLDQFELPDSDVRLSAFWPVESFSRYQAAPDDRPHVVVANPGWITRLETLPTTFGAVIIDATHPRTFSRLGELEHATRALPLRVVLTPALSERERSALGTDRLTWLWSPTAERAIADELRAPGVRAGTAAPPRTLYICDADPEFDRALATVRELLVTMIGLSPGQPALLDAWGLYHRLRQLSVPLLRYEALARQGWGGQMLREQLTQLSGINLPSAALHGPWNQLTDRLTEAYDLLSQRQEPAKFYAVGQRLEALLQNGDLPVYVVSPSRVESGLLQITMNELLPELSAHQLSGAVEFIHAREEARRVSQGEGRRSLLTGYRHGTLRYLNAYPLCAVDSVLYPHELPLEQGLHARSHASLATLEHTEQLRSVLTRLAVTCPKGDLSVPISPPPLQVLTIEGQPVRLLQTLNVHDAHLDLDDLVRAQLQHFNLHPDESRPRLAGNNVTAGAHVTLHFEDATSQRLADTQLLDVFYPDTGQLVRHVASDIRAGMHVVSMVDDAYTSLFDRLVDILDQRATPVHRMSLYLWRLAKVELQRKYPNVRELHRSLRQDGQTMDYSTLRSWLTAFGNESRTYPPMRLLALRSGLYSDEAMIEHTFSAIVTVRHRNRAAGRLLHSVLRAIAAGESYTAALKSARKLDASVSEVLAAVEVCRVQSVSRSHAA